MIDTNQGSQPSTSDSPTRTALVLGAAGGIGSEVVRALLRHGWSVRALTRHDAPPAIEGLAPAERAALSWVKGDAMQRESVVAAADRVDAIIHAVNPPGYQRWVELVLPMIDNSIAAAEASGARLVLPGNVYNFGPDAFPLLREDAPQRPTTVKGGVRVDMEARLEAAAERGVRSVVLRCGDFFGPAPGDNWFGQLVKAGKTPSSITYPGKPGVGHQWAYLPDVAETIAQLLERGQGLVAFARFHSGAHWDPDGTAMIAAIREAAGAPDLRVKRFPWWATALLAPFVGLLRETREMRYLWQVPVQLHGSRLEALLGDDLPHTPLVEAVRASLQGMGCLAETAPPQRQSVSIEATTAEAMATAKD